MKAAEKGLEMKEKEEYNGSEGQAKVRANGRVAWEAKKPTQATANHRKNP